MERTTIENSSNQHFEQLAAWLKMEAEAEAERIAHKRLLRSSKDAESSGETLLDLVVADSDPGLGGRFLVRMVKRNRELRLPWNRLRVGAPVLLAKSKDDQGESWPGVVSRRKMDSIQISVNEIPDGDSFRLDLSSDEISRKRCKSAIDTANKSRGRLGHVRRVLMAETEPKFGKPPENQPTEIGSPDLNQSQLDAIQFGLSAEDVAVIHGPPGTGKTTTIVELIIRAIQRGDKVLACAPSNTAVDNLVKKLHDRGQKPVRLGHPARVSQDLQSRTLDSLVEQDPNMRIAKEMLRESEDLFRKIDRYTRARPEPGARREMRYEAKQLRNDARLMERQAVEHVLDRAQVICGTTTIDDSLLGERWFDLLVIDEACQSTEPPCWIPICRCDKVIFAGDHCQLPPTVLSQEAAKQGFTKSLMERTIGLHGEQVTRMLDVQYRMHQQIMQFSSDYFYDGQLASHQSVAEHLISERFKGATKEFDSPVTFVDTAGANWSEEVEPDGESKMNANEARFVIDEVQKMNDAGIPLSEVAVIVPYAAQVRLIRRLAHEQFGQDHRLEIDTVDGFQGREKEAVVISLVRSNDSCEIGFLADTRRMNVAMTRARRHLFVIGDSATIGGNDFFQKLLAHFEMLGAYRSIWEFEV